MVRFKDEIGHLAAYLMFLLAIGYFVLFYEPFPPDDFLRHVRYLDYQSEGGYAYMYPHSSFEKFSFNPWFGFDLLTGTLKNVVGAETAIIVYQLLFISLFYVAIIINIRNPEEEKQWIGIYILFTLLLLVCCLGRLILIRPSVLIAVLTLICLQGRGMVAGFAMTAISAFLYYLYFLFFIPLAITHYFKGCKRFAIGVAVGVVLTGAIWLYQTDLEYLKTLWLLLSGVFDREGIVIAENVPFLSKFTNPVVFLIFVVFVVTVMETRRIDKYLLMFILTIPLSLQVRYFADIALSLMFIYAVKNSAWQTALVNSAYKKAIEASTVLAVILLLPPFASMSSHGNNVVRLDGIDLPKGSIVFSESMQGAFSTVYWNKELVKVLPAAEIGWNGKETKEMIKKINEEKKIDNSFCEYAERHGITHVLTSQVVSGECLKHIQTFNKGARIDLYAKKEG